MIAEEVTGDNRLGEEWHPSLPWRWQVDGINAGFFKQARIAFPELLEPTKHAAALSGLAQCVDTGVDPVPGGLNLQQEAV